LLTFRGFFFFSGSKKVFGGGGQKWSSTHKAPYTCEWKATDKNTGHYRQNSSEINVAKDCGKCGTIG